MHFPMMVNWREKKECGHDAKEGADKDSVYSSVPLKSVGLNLLYIDNCSVMSQHGINLAINCQYLFGLWMWLQKIQLDYSRILKILKQI